MSSRFPMRQLQLARVAAGFRFMQEVLGILRLFLFSRFAPPGFHPGLGFACFICSALPLHSPLPTMLTPAPNPPPANYCRPPAPRVPTSRFNHLMPQQPRSGLPELLILLCFQIRLHLLAPRRGNCVGSRLTYSFNRTHNEP